MLLPLSACIFGKSVPVKTTFVTYSDAVKITKNIRFKDECLEDILRVVNAEASALQIQTASPVLSKRKLTIEFENNSPETVAELICWALSLKCSREGDKLILSE